MLPRLKMGTSDFRPVYITERYVQILLTGAPGSGKTSLLLNWWEQDDFFGPAKILVEPSGLMAPEAYSISEKKDLYYCSLETPIPLNPLAQPGTRSQIIDNVCDATNQMVSVSSSSDELSVNMRGLLAKAVNNCLDHNRLSLLNVRDQVAKEKGSELTKKSLIARLDYLLEDERFNKILCGPNPIEWGDFISKGKTLIMDAFGMGRGRMIFCGSLICQGIKNYFRHQRPKVYKPLALYIDECHNFINPNIFDILKEGRKYKISCILSTQDFALISEKLVKTMLSVGNILTFRVRYEVASRMAREIGILDSEHKTVELIQNLPKYHLAYDTPNGRGIAKAPRPVAVFPMRPKKPKAQSTKKGWFPLEPYVDEEFRQEGEARK